ncbi:MAG TPA: NFACT family protein, partial [Polyangiaceae bacterium]|nr:NFACT family protein [Polyangiaceae bacterium]
MRRELLGGWVQRVSVADLAGRQLAHLSVRAEGETVPVLLVSGLGLGAIDKASNARLRASSRPQASSGLQARCRARIQGGRVVWASATAIAVVRDARTWLFESGTAGPLALTELEDASHIRGPPRIDREALDARGAEMAARLAEGGHLDQRQGLLRALARASSRVARRVEAIRGDLARIGEADGLARRAQLFVAAAAHAPRGATRLVAVDWSSGEPRTVELSLDPSRDARSQIEALFTRSRRLKEGAAIARARLAEAETSLRALRDVANALDTGEGDVEPLIERARAAAPRDFRTQTIAAVGKRAARQPAALPYRTFVAVSGARILV